MKKFQPNSKASRIHYVIREIVLEANKYEDKTGKKAIRLNIGDPAKYDFQPPQHVIDAYVRALNSGKNYYGNSQGELELRETIVDYEKRKNNIDLKPENIIVTQGAAEAVNTILAISFNPGEELLIPTPTYPPYISAAEFFDVNPVEYSCLETEGWIPDTDDIRKKISKKTKAILIINPNNPTGTVYNTKIVKEILDIAGEHDLFVISDEIYDLIVYDELNKAPNAASLANDVPVITLYSLSKVFLATGWRLGYMYLHDPNDTLKDIWSAMIRFLMIRLSVNTPAQYAAIEALAGPQDHIKHAVNKLQKRRDLVYQRINEIYGLSAKKPRGAFYIFPKIELESIDDKAFSYDLLWKTGVVVPPGSGFGSGGKQHFRIVFLPPEHILNEALDRIEQYMKKLS